MENNLQIFENEQFGQVRTLEIDVEPWFVGKDVAKALGYSNASKAVMSHVDKDDKQFIMIDTSDSQNGNPMNKKIKTAFINESGLYCLVLGSKLETAKQFKHWITAEVIPAIRKHGTYMTPEMIEKILYNPDTIIKIATALKEEQEKVRRLQATNAALVKEASTWDCKSIINALVRKYGASRCNNNFAWAWNAFYKQLEYSNHINLKVRAGKDKSTKPILDLLREDEYSAAMKTAVAMCESININTGDVINEVNLSAAMA